MLKKSYSTGFLCKQDFIEKIKLNIFEIEKPFVVVNSWCFDESENEFKCPSPPKKSKSKSKSKK